MTISIWRDQYKKNTFSQNRFEERDAKNKCDTAEGSILEAELVGNGPLWHESAGSAFILEK